jgi:hypothetical protein
VVWFRAIDAKSRSSAAVTRCRTSAAIVRHRYAVGSVVMMVRWGLRPRQYTSPESIVAVGVNASKGR